MPWRIYIKFLKPHLATGTPCSNLGLGLSNVGKFGLLLQRSIVFTNGEFAAKRSINMDPRISNLRTLLAAIGPTIWVSAPSHAALRRSGCETPSALPASPWTLKSWDRGFLTALYNIYTMFKFIYYITNYIYNYIYTAFIFYWYYILLY